MKRRRNRDALPQGDVIAPGGQAGALMIGLNILESRSPLALLDNRGRVRTIPPNIGAMMAFPYILILPMQAFILGGALLGATDGWATALFMVLKTIADEAMHASVRLRSDFPDSQGCRRRLRLLYMSP